MIRWGVKCLRVPGLAHGNGPRDNTVAGHVSGVRPSRARASSVRRERCPQENARTWGPKRQETFTALRSSSSDVVVWKPWIPERAA